MIEKIYDYDTWIEARKNGIGGSDSGAVLGVNKYKSNVQLWEEKTGKRQVEDISNKAAVQFGKQAEEHLRELFKLDYPEFETDYHEFWIYRNPHYEWLFATLDGELTAPDGSRGILEIKTTTIQNSSQWDEWDNKIPDSYYVQVLHQMAATGWDFAILKAYIRYHSDNEIRATVRHYRVDRKDVQEEIDFLIQQESIFWQMVKEDKRPPLILPNI